MNRRPTVTALASNKCGAHYYPYVQNCPTAWMLVAP
jgi:hypothetical protein